MVLEGRAGMKYKSTAKRRRLEFVLVEFHSYCGEPCFPEQPKLVHVPVQAAKARTKPLLMAGLLYAFAKLSPYTRLKG